jgi:hypothetical protein
MTVLPNSVPWRCVRAKASTSAFSRGLPLRIIQPNSPPVLMAIASCSTRFGSTFAQSRAL